MGIHVVWDDAEQSIIRWNFDAEWDWNDFHQAFKSALELSLSVNRRVDVIPYVGETPKVPPGMMSHFKSIENKMPDNVGLIIVTGAPMLTNVVIEMFTRIYRAKKWTTASNLEAAYQMIAESRKVES